MFTKLSLLKKNILANYTNQFFAAFLNILALPLYMKYLGPSQFGLIGIFSVLQLWLALLDGGMSQTLSREIAYCRNDKQLFKQFSILLRSIESILFLISIIFMIFMSYGSNQLANIWIGDSELPLSVTSICLKLMVFQICFKFFVAIYKSSLIGLEDQVALSLISITLNLIRYLGGLILLIFITNDVVQFFQYQLVVAILEASFFMLRFYRVTKGLIQIEKIITIDLIELKRIGPFALGIFYSTLLWMLMTQLDKVIFSSTLSLREFGYLSVLTLLASIVLQLSAPITQAFIPRFTRAIADNQDDIFKAEYSKCTRTLTIMVTLVFCILIYHSDYLLLLMTDNNDLVEWSSNILIYYTAGNIFIVIAGMQYLLQYSLGNLSWHIKGVTISFLIQTPAIIYIAINYGVEACAMTFMIIRLIWFLAWTWFIHNKFIRNYHMKWLLKDVIINFLIVLIGFYFINLLMPKDYDQFFLYHFFSITFSIGLASILMLVFYKYEGKFLKL